MFARIEGDNRLIEVLSYEATTGRFAYKEVVSVIAHDGVTELAHVTVYNFEVKDWHCYYLLE